MALVEHIGRDWHRAPTPRELRLLRALRDAGANVPRTQSTRALLKRMARTGWLVEEYEEVDGDGRGGRTDGRAYQLTGFYLSSRGYELLETVEDVTEEAR